MKTVGFRVDALHVIETMAELARDEAGVCAPGMIIGLQLMHGLLQRVAERAVELNDKKMLELMERLHLVEKVEKEGGAE